LEFEGFSNADATYGVDALNVNWNDQAAKKAAEYLRSSSFSKSGLTQQLVYEGFTQAQAAYGVSTTGL
jgi:colicin import membrane protein